MEQSNILDVYKSTIAGVNETDSMGNHTLTRDGSARQAR